MKNNQKGITLIALVVTIIVLLILAGVSIAMLTGEGGVLGNAREASIKTKLMNTADEISLTVSQTATKFFKDKYTGDDVSTSASTATELTKKLNDSIKELVGDNNANLPKGMTYDGSLGEESGTLTLKLSGWQTTAKYNPENSMVVWSEPTTITAGP